MTALAIQTAKQRRASDNPLGSAAPGLSAINKLLLERAARATYASATSVGYSAAPYFPVVQLTPLAKSLAEKLFDVGAASKVSVNQLAMHFGRGWQQKLFLQLDAVLDSDEWDASDQLLTPSSFTTFLHILLLLRGKRRPGIGISSTGDIVAMWTVDANRLTFQCHADDWVTWIVSRVVDDETHTAAGRTTLPFLFAAIGAFNPEQWFTDEGPKSPA